MEEVTFENVFAGYSLALSQGPDTKHRVVDFMFDRMKDTYLAKFKQLENSRAYVRKRHLVVSHVNDYVLKKPHIK